MEYSVVNDQEWIVIWRTNLRPILYVYVDSRYCSETCKHALVGARAECVRRSDERLAWHARYIPLPIHQTTTPLLAPPVPRRQQVTGIHAHSLSLSTNCPSTVRVSYGTKSQDKANFHKKRSILLFTCSKSLDKSNASTSGKVSKFAI